MVEPPQNLNKVNDGNFSTRRGEHSKFNAGARVSMSSMSHALLFNKRSSGFLESSPKHAVFFVISAMTPSIAPLPFHQLDIRTNGPKTSTNHQFLGSMLVFRDVSLPKTNITPENDDFQLGIYFSRGLFSGDMLVFRDVSLREFCLSICHLDPSSRSAHPELLSSPFGATGDAPMLGLRICW